ncbi:hypothetical protein BpHYR1_039762 [Brachionus plicatilis]|uniref:Uncharacterized protein n=1 Tax=Brachionus plicatilis TaxID=10195 RepID=A0A3M7SL96_BRAPC|nr:hypothetical protein BpHYR1_039762 [Brachionus plicatilis]
MYKFVRSFKKKPLNEDKKEKLNKEQTNVHNTSSNLSSENDQLIDQNETRKPLSSTKPKSRHESFASRDHIAIKSFNELIFSKVMLLNQLNFKIVALRSISIVIRKNALHSLIDRGQRIRKFSKPLYSNLKIKFFQPGLSFHIRTKSDKSKIIDIKSLIFKG